MATTDINRILCLLERPVEPVFVPKGRNNLSFDIRREYLAERFRPFETEIFNRFCTNTESKVPVKNIVMPDMTIPMELQREEMFSLFIPKHQKIAGSLIDIFLRMDSYDDLLAVAASWRDKLNPYLFFYAFSVAIINRNDTKSLSIPPLHEVFPGKFFNSSIFIKAKEQANIVPAGSRIPIEIPKDNTASDLDPEHRLAYFREDIGINLHHWHWHLVYPFRGSMRVVNKDRRGELFYYMHGQIIARYNCERLCAKLGRVKKLNNFRDPIPEAYFPKLNSLVASKPWASRPSGLSLQDVNRPLDGYAGTIEDLERWRDRIYTAIHKGEITSSTGETITLTEKDGIDILGNIIESSLLTANQTLYGDLHNRGHMLISCCHDPDYRYLEPFGVMGDVATSMRDPIFYRWHDYINDIFLEYKNTLPEYSVNQLSFAGIEVSKCQITTPNAPDNTMMTFWTQTDIDLSKGLDFSPQGDIPIRITHLNHAKFKYEMTVINRSNVTKFGTVRIFMGPKLDERDLPFALRAQMELMIEMDKFTVTLRPGNNTVLRNSTDSSVTIPFEMTFRNLDDNSTKSTDAFNFCGCGWPQHMLVPRGTSDGYPMELFVMISNHQLDYVEQAPPDGCSGASSFCGLRDRKYPDARAMGYPFDRKPRAGIDTLSAFLTSNMALTEIQVKWRNTIIKRSSTTA